MMLRNLKKENYLDLETPWGKPSDQILKTKYNNKEVYFLPRHGRGHFISPSNINFRANIDALKQLGVTDIVSVSAVGSLKEDCHQVNLLLLINLLIEHLQEQKLFLMMKL